LFEIIKDNKMDNKILVTYASRSGTTADIAAAVAKTLVSGGLDVDIFAMQSVKDLSPYRAVVAGSAIQKSKWLPEAFRFIQTHRAVLLEKPLALFTVCITLAMKNGQNYRPTVVEWVQPVRTMVKPVSEGYFAGMLDFNKLPVNLDTILFHISVALGIFPRGDRRDWNAIHAWAQEITPLLVK
jgi:menaquinone-dependent protoporphyrinogen oxidase